jgi:bifunctional DNase/RNase
MLELKILGVSQPNEHPYPLVLLQHENRILPILVGMAEASAIQMGLSNEKTLRPMTHDLISNILVGLRANLKSVTIYRLENDTFFAHLNVEQLNAQGHVEQVLRIDTRPSDGIAVAVRMACPIFVAEEVMDAAAQDASILTSEGEAESDGESFEGNSEEPDFDA